MRWYYGFPKYVSVAERKEKAEKKIEKLRKKGQDLNPIIITTRTIATTFWGKAWCDNLEKFCDYANRLPRGRSYARNGSIIDLKISTGKVQALVQGTSLYKVSIDIVSCSKDQWKKIMTTCAGKIDSLIELLQGKLSENIMHVMTNKESGLFPELNDFALNCSCLDYATMCKHVAAVLYGIGARLDTCPQDLFILRNVDHFELLKAGTSATALANKQNSSSFADNDLTSLFGIDIESNGPSSKKPLQQIMNSEPQKKRAAKNIKKTQKTKSKKIIKKSGTIKKKVKKTD